MIVQPAAVFMCIYRWFLRCLLIFFVLINKVRCNGNQFHVMTKKKYVKERLEWTSDDFANTLLNLNIFFILTNEMEGLTFGLLMSLFLTTTKNSYFESINQCENSSRKEITNWSIFVYSTRDKENVFFSVEFYNVTGDYRWHLDLIAVFIMEYNIVIKLIEIFVFILMIKAKTIIEKLHCWCWFNQ